MELLCGDEPLNCVAHRAPPAPFVVAGALEEDVRAHEGDDLPKDEKVQVVAVARAVEGEEQRHGYEGRQQNGRAGGGEAEEAGQVVTKRGVEDEEAGEDGRLVGLHGEGAYLRRLAGALQVLDHRLAHVSRSPVRESRGYERSASRSAAVTHRLRSDVADAHAVRSGSGASGEAPATQGCGTGDASPKGPHGWTDGRGTGAQPPPPAARPCAMVRMGVTIAPATIAISDPFIPMAA